MTKFKAHGAKVVGVVLGVLSIMVIGATAAFAAVDTAAVSAVSDGAEGLKDTLVAVAVAVLPFAAAILAITLGWKLARRFVRG